MFRTTQAMYYDFFLTGAHNAVALMWEARNGPDYLDKTWKRETGFRHWWNAKR